MNGRSAPHNRITAPQVHILSPQRAAHTVY